MDFGFAHLCFQHFGHEFPLQAGEELFQIFQTNFCAYLASGVYRVEVSPL
jgi:hypothetical protein